MSDSQPSRSDIQINKKKEKNNFLEYFFEDYWDIFIGISSILVAFYIHNSHSSIVFSTLFAAIGIGALSLTVSE